ncbi:MAG: DUF6029 family protein [Bacteroidales bacterium]|nr:DUF6029 family protein [Bacteroidales bacterium]
MKKVVFAFLFLFSSFPIFSQGILGGRVTGNFQMDFQASRQDSVIGAEKINEKVLMNAFTNILYTNGDFTMGMRFEAYLNPILGFDKQYKGAGLAYRFASYKKDFLEITAGNYYEQFGNGLIFRSYEERNLGLDNAMDGLRIVARPFEGVAIKGIIGKQRYYWEDIWASDDFGLVRGLDAEISLNSLIKKMNNSPLQLILGGSFVSVYNKQDDRFVIDPISGDSYKMNMPENIGSAAARVAISYKAFNLNAEYAKKGEDPNAVNGYIFRKGEAAYITAGYSVKGFGVNVAAKRIDNMSFKSRRSETGNMLNVNYLPALTAQHTYSLFAMYPYATQVNGEMGIQADIMYKIKKKTFLGGKYGMDLKLNYSRATSLDKNMVNKNPAGNYEGTLGYESSFFKMGDELYFEEINFEVNKKLSNNYKLLLMYSYQTFNPIAIGHYGEEFVYANVFAADLTQKIGKRNSLRYELQLLFTEQNYGSWALGNWLQATMEFNLKGNFFASATDQWNYGNKVGEKVHYYNFSIGYTIGTTRIQLSYGKQREGIICIGGVCRMVPASNGLFATITSSF